ncbi:SNX29 [Acanthosepion pharaonis]|uniref:SNX29 n=1 Tax=Acanthosepion pharaonis TaxID=158019 RepID=A0A812AUH3_ACAPH|nr:SNX29 [Sepia pharaonis]
MAGIADDYQLKTHGPVLSENCNKAPISKKTDYDFHLAERQSLLTRLLDAVKQCQVRFGGRRELATDGDSRQVTEITGLSKVTRFAEMEAHPAFWQNVKEHLTKHELQRFLLLKSVNTEMGRGRAWLRASLNEHSLERYMHMIIEKDDILSQYYEDWAFLRDQERSSMLPNMAAGLGSILFALTIDSPEINAPISSAIPLALTSEKIKPETTPDIQPVMATNKPAACDRKRDKKKRKKLANIVTFSDDDDQISSISSSPCSVQNDSFDISAKSSLDSPSYLANTDRLHFNDYTQVDSPLTKSSGLSSPSVTNESNKQSPKNNDENHKSSSPSELGLIFKFGKKPPLKAVDSQSSLTSDDLVGDDAYLAPVSSIAERRLSQGSGSSLEMDGKYCKQPLIPMNSEGEYLDQGGDGDSSGIHQSVALQDFVNLSGTDIENAAFALVMAQKGSNNDSHGYRTEGDGGNVQEESHKEMTTMELKQAIVTMMLRKDQVEDQNRSLQTLLSQEQETSLALRAELKDINTKMSVLQEKDNCKIQSLQKENELLRHQLKKYVNAVQLLRKEGPKAEGKLFSPPFFFSPFFFPPFFFPPFSFFPFLFFFPFSFFSLSLFFPFSFFPFLFFSLSFSSLSLFSSLSSFLWSLGIHLDELQPVIPPPKANIDYSHEASEYEKKLIQVAEMHGELMEFNEVLHRKIQSQDTFIKQLRQELVNLRGPLPNEVSSYSENLSIDVDNLSLNTRNLVHVWIPSAFLRGSASDSYHVYQVYVRIQDEEWNVYRRYRQFYVLYCKLKKKYPILGQFNFPPKVTVGYKEARVVEKRRVMLQTYLRKVINCVMENSNEISTSITKNTLLQLLPFFGDMPEVNNKRKKKNEPAPNQSVATNSAIDNIEKLKNRKKV